ncbi:hypothetical protein IQ231_20320 [Cuspidothrix issatschenkoi LEGE 03284]|jgi:hypothetical protein|uniref:hypothetical protein n=1 Tax=Cuspidothrix issatschenkoi TaxID=230752 RepID=UPI00187E156C|nr:hypothetical protein [Cuspidothrix issatschenkoi]MBE9233946.1 hypothetical protein [Cuspidothrix issatschenkoi LEGE 03284]
MSYSQFTLEQIKSDFGITLSEKVGFFAQVPERKYSQLLDETLEYNIPLALSINSEKSRSEMIVTPILIEVRKQLNNQISLFSGKDFNVDAQKGLTGFCDFLISKSNEQLIIESPIITLVEAKNDNIESGLAQCMAEMIAAQLFNQRQNQEIKRIYGVITTGSIWKFMQLEATTITIDLNEYFLVNVDKIIGILIHFIESTNN